MGTKENPGNPEENMGCTEAAEHTEETEALAIARTYEEHVETVRDVCDRFGWTLIMN